jgi:hypothetical protein
MFVTATTVHTGDQPIENATMVAEELARWLRDIDGFEGFVMLSQPGRTIGFTFWSSREVAERHQVPRRQFIERMSSIADVQIEQMDGFEVTYAELGPRLARVSP